MCITQLHALCTMDFLHRAFLASLCSSTPLVLRDNCGTPLLAGERGLVTEPVGVSKLRTVQCTECRRQRYPQAHYLHGPCAAGRCLFLPCVAVPCGCCSPGAFASACWRWMVECDWVQHIWGSWVTGESLASSALLHQGVSWARRMCSETTFSTEC